MKNIMLAKPEIRVRRTVQDWTNLAINASPNVQAAVFVFLDILDATAILYVFLMMNAFQTNMMNVTTNKLILFSKLFGVTETIFTYNFTK
jgi:hypothetical protein